MCQISLRSDINSSASPGGIWTYLGYNPTDPTTGVWNFTPSNPLVPTPIGQTISGDDPLVDSTGKSVGFYRFSYTVTNEGCTDTEIFIVQVRQANCAGDDFTISLCSNTPTISLAQFFDDYTTCSLVVGSIAGVSGSPVIGSSPNYNFNPSVNGPGTFVVRNTVVSSPYAGFSSQCEDCTQTADATIVVIAFRSAGDERFVPYFSVCTDPSCTVSLPSLLLSLPVGSQDGDWWLREAEVGFPSYVDAQLTLNTNLFPNVSHNYFPHTKITNGTVNGTVNFSNADTGFVYNFEYIVGAGTPCETSQTVQVYVGPIPDAGIPPSVQNICMTNLISNNGGPVMNLWAQLGGTPSTQGTWSFTHNYPGSYNTRFNRAFDQGNTDPLFVFNGQDDFFDWDEIRNRGNINDGPFSPGTTLTFNFTYQAQMPSSYLCANCAPESSTFTKNITIDYLTGTSPHSTIGTAYLCSNGCTIDLGSLVSGADDFARWRVGTTAISNLIRIDPNFGPDSPTNFSVFQNLSFTSDFTSPFTQLNLDFSLVPAGTYHFQLFGGSAPCDRITNVYITVTQPPPACLVDVTIIPS